MEELLVVEVGEVLEVVLFVVVEVEDDEGKVLLLVVEVVVLPVVVFEGTELVKVGILVVTLPVGVMVLPL